MAAQSNNSPRYLDLSGNILLDFSNFMRADKFSATSLSRLTGKRIDNKKLLETFLQDFEESYFVDNFRGKD